MGGYDCFEGKRASGDKNQCNLFSRKLGFAYFSFYSFFEKTIFSKITVKKNFGGHDHSSGNGTSGDKNV